MANNVNNKFFSKENQLFVYGQIQNKIQMENKYDINLSPRFKSHFPKLMGKIYDTIPNSEKNLHTLNRMAIDKITPHFVNQIGKVVKNEKQSNTILPRPLYENQSLNRDDFDNLVSRVENERGYNNNNHNNQSKTIIDLTPKELKYDNDEVRKNFAQLNKLRENEQKISTITSQNSIGNTNNKDIGNYQIDPFSLEDDILESLNGNSQPLFQNMDILENRNSQSIKDQYNKEMELRNGNDNKSFPVDNDISRYSTQGRDPNQISESVKPKINLSSPIITTPNRKEIMNQITKQPQHTHEEFNPSPTLENYIIDKSSFNDPPDYRELEPSSFREEKTKDNTRDIRWKTQIPKATNEIPSDNPLYDFYQAHQILAKRKYRENSHYITLSSIDRNWVNNVESRYNFVLKFNPSSSPNGASIDYIYKNIISIEIMKVIFPQENDLIAFDSRILVNIKSFPFIVLSIDEIDGVFRGSNNNINEAFAQLHFDKEFATITLPPEYITTESNGVGADVKFANQYVNGRYVFNPFLFEKKKYFNTPLASLNRMTIKFLTSYGTQISCQKDVLKIASIDFVDPPGDLELSDTNGFPMTDNCKYIMITTTTHFSNRTFKIGNLIKIKGYTISSTDSTELQFQVFINREEGHRIINLEQEKIAGPKNNGYLTKMYISPPGEIDLVDKSLDGTTYYEVDPTVVEYGDLINVDLQVYMSFKIVTREEDTQELLGNFNV
jgi:hypothetical protein